MKKLFLIALIAAGMFCTAKAQQGSILVMGNLGFSSNSYAGSKQNTFNFSPGAGYQFNDKWTVGGELGIGSEKTKPEGGSETKSSTFSVGPFVRYTHQVSDIFNLFGQCGLGYQQAKAGDAKSSGMYAKLFPAVFINVKNGFGLNFDFGGVTYVSLKPGNGDAASQFSFNFGRNLNIGISKNF